MAAEDWLCQIGFEEDGVSYVTIVHQDFWEENGYVDDDSYLTEAIEEDVPSFDLMDVTENEYEFLGSREEARDYLESLGMIVVDYLYEE